MLPVAVNHNVASEASQHVLDRLGTILLTGPPFLHILTIHHGVVKWKHTSTRGV